MDDSPSFDSRAVLAAEQDVIAGAVLQPGRLASCVLEPRHFTPGPNRDLWAILLSLHGDGEPIDNVSVAERCEANGTFEHFTYLGEILAGYVDSDTWAYKAGRLLARSQSLDLWRSVQHALQNRDEATIIRCAEAITAREAIGSKRAVIASMDTAYQSMVDEWAEARTRPTLSWGISKLDANVKPLQPTRLYVVGARPAMGKTAFMLNVAVRNAQAGRRVGILSVEQSMEELSARSLCILSRCPMDWITGEDPQLPIGDVRKIDDAKIELRNLPITIIDQTPMTIAQARSWARTLVHRHGCELLVVDYLQKLDADAKERRLEVARVAKGLKDIARNLKVPVLVGAQMRRDAEDRSPTMADLGESAVIEHEADVILALALHRDKPKDADEPPGPSTAMRVLVLKNRHGQSGTYCPVTYRGETYRFENYEGRYA